MNLNQELYFREADETDRELLLKWANETETRKQSFNEHPITQEEHNRWFQNVLKSDNIRILILYLQERPVGNVRFTIDDKTAVLSYSIDYHYRGFGLGKKLIEMAITYAKKNLSLSSLQAMAKQNNIVSQRVLLGNGFFPKEELSKQAGFLFFKNLQPPHSFEKLRIFFRADGNEQIGTGHIMRCLSLADVFRDRGADCIFVTAEPYLQPLIQERGYECLVLGTEYDHMDEELPAFLPLLEERRPSCVILDSYFATPGYMRSVRSEAPVVYIDDLNTFDYPADIVVNYNLYAEKMAYPPNKKHLFGPRYAPLRRQFQGLEARVTNEQVREILVSTGGTDQYHVALRCAEYLREHPPASGITYHLFLAP